ncbi:MAG: response regulator transcription factor [Anaerolineales bacterium]|jgi:two-component system NarL family response regulator
MKILIVDDHALLVEGLCNLLVSRGFEVVGTAGDGQEGVEQALRLEPDLVLMDIRMPRCDGLCATRLIKAQRPDMKIVMLTTSAEDDDLFEAIKSGACGYLLKSTQGAAFIEALHGLEEGTPPFSPGLAARLLREFAHLSEGEKRDTENGEKGDGEKTKLTERQTEVLRLVASGLTYKEAAARLMLSDHTVRYHMSEIMQLLHLENRSQVIAYAGKLGLK